MILDNGEEWITAQDAEERWPDVTADAVRHWAARGKLNGQRVGRRTYYDLNALTEAEHAARTSARGAERGVARRRTDQVHS